MRYFVNPVAFSLCASFVLLTGCKKSGDSTTPPSPAQSNTYSIDKAYAKGNANGTVFTAAQQPDGKLIIGGAFTSFQGVAVGRIARLNADGTVDASFATGSGFSGTRVKEIRLQQDGKVLVCGDFPTFNGVARPMVARLNANGSLDHSFNPPPITKNALVPAVNTICLQPDGRILLGGDFYKLGLIERDNVCRLNADGSLDPSLEVRTVHSVGGINVLPDGKLLLRTSGFTTSGAYRYNLVRTLANGFIDLSFHFSETPYDAFMLNFPGTLYAVALLDDGKILIGGNFGKIGSTIYAQVARLNADGSLDHSFKNDTAGTMARVVRIMQIGDGKALVARGNEFVYRVPVYLQQVNGEGAFNHSMEPKFNEYAGVFDIVKQSNQQYIVVGDFTTVDGMQVPGVVRLTLK